jgi:hypothetical protein
MHFNLESIPLAQINAADTTYRITTAKRGDNLINSIAAIGLMSPPIIFPDIVGYRTIAGFRRIEACRDLGWTHLKVRLLPVDCDEETLVKWAIADNSLQRPLNLIESSRALNLLAKVTADARHLSKCAAILALPSNPEMITKLISLITMATTIQRGVESGDLTLAMALEIDQLDRHTGEALAQIFIDLRLGLNRQRELMSLLFEIAKREDRSIEALLAEKEVKKIIDNEGLNNPQKSGQLRNLLYKRRYPAISERSIRFDDLVNALHLGRGVKLSPPVNFEGTSYTLSIAFDGIDQLDKRAKCLEVLKRSEMLKKFMAE